jgi:hypothetical protein
MCYKSCLNYVQSILPWTQMLLQYYKTYVFWIRLVRNYFPSLVILLEGLDASEE